MFPRKQKRLRENIKDNNNNKSAPFLLINPQKFLIWFDVIDQRMETAGEWLEKALLDLCKRIETGLDLDGEIISGLVSYCELAQPLDAKEYLDVIFYLFMSRCF